MIRSDLTSSDLQGVIHESNQTFLKKLFRSCVLAILKEKPHISLEHLPQVQRKAPEHLKFTVLPAVVGGTPAAAARSELGLVKHNQDELAHAGDTDGLLLM